MKAKYLELLRGKRLWLIDFDGPINNIVFAFANVYRHILLEFMNVPEDQVERYLYLIYIPITSFGDGCKILYDAAMKDGYQSSRTLEEMSSSWSYWSKLDNEVPYVEGALDSLIRLGAFLGEVGGKRVIISNRSLKSFEPHREKIAKAIDYEFIDNKGQDYKSKPDPEMLFRAAGVTGIPLTEAIMIGDGEVDYLAAHNASWEIGAEIPYFQVGNGRPGKPVTWPAYHVPSLPCLIDLFLSVQ